MPAKILVVDDSPTMRKMIEFALKTRGHLVVLAADGQEGLEALEKGEKIDLAILDINMPRLDGLSMLKTLRQKPARAHLPILMLTTEGEDADRDTALALGATDYMAKPFKPTELLERVAQLIEQGQQPK